MIIDCDKLANGYTRTMPRTATTALLIIDVQNDFCAGGALAVPDGDAVVSVINDMAARASEAGMPIYATRDWHPRVTRHFKTYGGPWPEHCVAGTPGAQFHPDLRLPEGTVVVTTGDVSDSDGYSAFDGRLPDGRSLAQALNDQGIQTLIVGGLATDYCVKHSVVDARTHGFGVVVVRDAIRGVEVVAGDSDRAVEIMKAAGATFVESSQVDV